MATRSLTEAFILMRNNSLQSRHIYSEQGLDDRVALVNRDIESGFSQKDHRLPPEWVDGVEEFHYEITRIKQKLKDFAALRDKHLNRPTLDDTSDEEMVIEHNVQEITRMFHHCQRLIHQISSKCRGTSAQEQRIGQNVVASLVSSLQELYVSFRTSQSNYIKKLKSREERSLQYFDSGLTLLGDSGTGTFTDPLREDMTPVTFGKDQLLLIEDNTLMTELRDKEITQIVRSIEEMHEIFKDLGQIVVDQGTVLDRIDYNIEHSQVKVREGLKQLQKAETYQKKNTKMYCILILAAITTILIIILIAVKLG